MVNVVSMVSESASFSSALPAPLDFFVLMAHILYESSRSIVFAASARDYSGRIAKQIPRYLRFVSSQGASILCRQQVVA